MEKNLPFARQWMPMESDRLAEYETKSPGNPGKERERKTEKKNVSIEVSMLQKIHRKHISCHAGILGLMNHM